MSKANYTKRDPYQEVTDSIIKSLEQGFAPWVRPWNNVGDAIPQPYNYASKNDYHGINVLILLARTIESGYSHNGFITYKQAQDLGGHVRKGEKGTGIIFWKFLEKQEKNNQGEDETVKIPMARFYTVFNVEQCEGLDLPTIEEIPEAERIAHAESFAANTGAVIRHGGNQAFYNNTQNAIGMPHRAQFKTLEDYYATLFHELTHWTRHPSRLDRGKDTSKEDYAFEELIAELGAAFLCSQQHIPGKLQHDAYIGSWLKVLKEDKRAIFRAASQAQKAVEYLNSLQTDADQVAA